MGFSETSTTPSTGLLLPQENSLLIQLTFVSGGQAQTYSLLPQKVSSNFLGTVLLSVIQEIH